MTNGWTSQALGPVNMDWEVEGVYDLDGNGAWDILLRNYGSSKYTRLVGLWLMDENGMKHSSYPGKVGDLYWEIK